MKRITILILLLNIVYFVKAQNLTQYNDFFISKIPEYKGWLHQSNLGGVLNFDTIEIKQNKVKLLLNIYDKKQKRICDKANFIVLNDTIKAQYNKSIAEILFYKFSFLMDLENNQIEINIDSKDAYIDIWYENQNFVIDIMDKMGEVGDGYKIKIKNIKSLNKSNTTISHDTISFIKEKLKKGLRAQFKSNEAYWEKYKFKVRNELGNELKIEINNVVSLVIEDHSYFEHIEILFKFVTVNKSVKIDYVIRAKYGSGIIWAPKNSDYYDMTPTYHEDLERFSIELKNNIDKIIKN